jgi:TRAP-type C4-dicarboxylate transport system substrate-binding protein
VLFRSPTILAKKFYEVQSHINLTAHITDSLVVIVGSPLWRKLSEPERKTFTEVFQEAAARASDQIDQVERTLPEEFKKLGKTVVNSDRPAFQKAAYPLVSSGEAGWTKEHYDRFQALK